MPVRGPGALEMPGAGTSGMEWVLTLLYDVYVICYILKVVLSVWYGLVCGICGTSNDAQKSNPKGQRWVGHEIDC